MIKQFVPKEYRLLLDYISPAAFKVVDWKGAMTQFMALSKHTFDKSFLKELAEANVKLFSSQVQLKNLQGTEEMHFEGSELTKTQFAELILDIYFSQFFSGSGVLLDLRLKHFENKNGYVIFDPGSFVHSFKTKFRRGMLEIYRGYYQNRPEKMESGMLAVGLIKNSDPAEIEETKEILFSHFGEANKSQVEFSLEHFKRSFHDLFLYLKQKDIRLTSDFLFLGTYLVTLYLALSKIGTPVNVKKVFEQAWERNQK